MQARDPYDAGLEASLTKNTLGLARVAALQRRWKDADRLFASGRAAAFAQAGRDRTNRTVALQVRAFDLFRVRAQLSMPVAERPRLATMRSVLGNYETERRRAAGSEVALLCTVSEARLLALSGDPNAARQLLSSLRCEAGYSERWRIASCDERDTAIRANSATAGEDTPILIDPRIKNDG